MPSDKTSETINNESNKEQESTTHTEGVSFADFELPEALERALKDAGWVKPTTVQAKSIPPALEGRDVLASAQTGTGKTAAFAVPAIDLLLDAELRKEADSRGGRKGPRVLVLTPTRELAGQVEGVIRQLARKTSLRMGKVVGGVSYGPQERTLRGPLDLLVATPGRLIDHMERGNVDLGRVELFVLDEADRMLDLGFVKPVKRIASALPNERQTLLFSATLEGQVMSIARALLHEPVEVRLASVKVRHEGIEQRMHTVDGPEQKQAMLGKLLSDPALVQAIVFTATKRGADRLAKRLKTEGHSCAALHGNMRQNARDRTVELLRNGKVRVLVATDVAARGIDVDTVSHVINFDLPQVAEDYIHRIGRTGRNGASGIAVSLVGPQDRAKLGQIERLTGRRIDGSASEVRGGGGGKASQRRPHAGAPAQGAPSRKKPWQSKPSQGQRQAGSRRAANR